MQVISLDSVPLLERQHVRQGTFFSRRILNGTPGTPGNFSLQLSVAPNYHSPRHRHNFDQVRYQLEGDFDFAADGVMKSGTIAYFPEGTYYGPQSSAAENSTLVLQFGGASGSGYISPEQYETASAELAKRGTFSGGVYTRIAADGAKVNKDSYEAVWEQVNGCPLVYPKQRYLRPVFMDPQNFEWLEVDQCPGVSRKYLGEFAERHTRIAFLRLDRGASVELEDNSIYFLTAGAGSVFAGESPRWAKDFELHTTIYLAPRDRATICASRSVPAALLHLGLPRFEQ